MRLLLDSHVFIWWYNEPERISPRALALCQDPENDLFLSVVSLWEIQIKSQLGKLALRVPLEQIVLAQEETNGLIVLPITAAHVYGLGALPNLHKDPFDRLLVAQAKAENLGLITEDKIVKQYPVEVVW